MAGEYTIKILSSEEFSKLPFKRIMENPGPVFGAADPRTKTAYIRDTGYNDINKATISHELDELIAEVSPHEEDGIRYKDFSQSFGDFLGKAPVIGKPLGAVGRFAGSGIDALGQGAAKIGLPSFNIGNPSVGQFGDSVRADKIGKMGGPIYGPEQAPSPGIFSKIGGGIKKLGGGINDFFSGGFGGGGAAPKIGGGTSIGGKDLVSTQKSPDFWEQAKSAAPGALVSLLGNLFAPKVDAPDYSGVKADLAKRIGEGNSPAFDLGFGEAKRIIETPFGQLPEAVLEPIYERRDRELEALDSQFRLNQQGGQSSLRDATRYGELQNDIREKYESEIEQLAFQYQQQQTSNKMQMAQTLLNLDQAQYEQYSQLAMLDVATITEQYGVDVQTATDFKELFGNVGGQMIDSALNPNQSGSQGGITINV